MAQVPPHMRGNAFDLGPAVEVDAVASGSGFGFERDAVVVDEAEAHGSNALATSARLSPK